MQNFNTKRFSCSKETEIFYKTRKDYIKLEVCIKQQPYNAKEENFFQLNFNQGGMTFCKNRKKIARRYMSLQKRYFERFSNKNNSTLTIYWKDIEWQVNKLVTASLAYPTLFVEKNIRNRKKSETKENSWAEWKTASVKKPNKNKQNEKHSKREEQEKK